MNQNNLDFLKDSLKYLGFGEKLNADLESKIKEQPAAFKLEMMGEFNKHDINNKVSYTLDFSKSDQSDMYFLNKYQATLKNNNPELERSQTFYINKGSGITAKEAYNLLSGRAVNKDLTNKEGQPYNAWLQLDFQEKDKNDNYKVKQYHAGYGYDLESTIAKYPIRDQADEKQKADMIKSLEKGNLTQVTFVKDGKDEKMFIEANPQFKSLNLYDARHQKIYQGLDKKEGQGKEAAPEKKETKKQEVEDEGEPKKTKKSSRKKGIGV